MRDEVEMREHLNPKGSPQDQKFIKKNGLAASISKEEERSSPSPRNGNKFYSVSIPKEGVEIEPQAKVAKNAYILISLVAALFNSTGQIVRGYESRSPIVGNFLFGTAWSLLPIAFIVYKKIQGIRSGQNYLLPWNKRQESSVIGELKPIFVPRIMGLLALGGLLEFIGCQLMMISWQYGQKALLNDGITSALILFSSVFILFFQYLIYKEKINFVQGVGLGIIMIGVVVISFFKSEADTNGDGIFSPEDIIEGHGLNKFICIGVGLIAAVSFGTEILLVKPLEDFQVSGEITGIFYSFFVSICGIVGLVFYSVMGGMSSEAFTLGDYFLILLGGFFETLGMVFTIYAASTGVAGIAMGLAQNKQQYSYIKRRRWD